MLQSRGGSGPRCGQHMGPGLARRRLPRSRRGLWGSGLGRLAFDFFRCEQHDLYRYVDWLRGCERVPGALHPLCCDPM